MTVIKRLIYIWWTELRLSAGTLTRGRSLDSKAETDVETPGFWAVCSITISQCQKMRWEKLDTHTDTRGKLCARSRICVASKNGGHEISYV